MSDAVVAASDEPAIPLRLVTAGEAEAVVEALPAGPRAQARLAKFKGKAAEVVTLAGENGPELALAGLGEGAAAMPLRALPARLPAGLYALEPRDDGLAATDVALAFALGAYRFDRYREKKGEAGARLVLPAGVDGEELRAISHACALARDMVNTPANDMGARQIETIAREVAEAFGAEISVVVGDDLLTENYPAIHAVGRAAVPERAPRMIEIRWGAAGAPLVAIVGKGVVFDTGGLDIKPSAGMRTMKKDMGGAAHALALGRMAMAAKLPIRVAVLLPVAENAIAGDAMRPGDVLNSRKGLTIEVGNTDAEGRLILADALARAAELEPDLTIDMATLTGAARVALGPDVPPFYTDDETLAGQIEAAARAAEDPVWRMPLWSGYESAIESDVADLRNDPDGWAQAGSVTAALFLRRFAPKFWRLGPPRHFRLESAQPSRVARRRRGPGDSRPLPDAQSPLRMTPRDPRLTLARADLAGARLEGVAAAARYEPAREMAVTAPVAPLHRAPDIASERMDELIFGERFDALEESGGFVRGQARRDGYVGFVPADALARAGPAPTHLRGRDPHLCVRGGLDQKPRARRSFSLNALVAVDAEEGAFSHAAGGGFFWTGHLAPIGAFERDPAARTPRVSWAPPISGAGRTSPASTGRSRSSRRSTPAAAPVPATPTCS